MMALFMVLWISAQDKKIVIATSRYFQNPFSSPMEAHSGVMSSGKDTHQSSKTDDSNESSNSTAPNDQDKQIQIQFLNSAAADFYRMLNLNESPENKPVDIDVTSDGLRLTLYNRPERPVFVDETADFTPFGHSLVQNLSWMIDRYHFRVTIDGHTRSGLVLKRDDYTAWELSSDRANAARRAFVHYAVLPEQIDRVTGYADTQPLPGTPREAEANQRLTVCLTLNARPRAGVTAPSANGPTALAAQAERLGEAVTRSQRQEKIGSTEPRTQHP